MIRAAALLIAGVLSVGCGSSTGGVGGGTGGSGGSGGGSSGGGAGGGTGGGSGGSGGAGGGSAITADEACTAYATALCNRIDACIPFSTLDFYGDVATCIARYKLSCVPALGLPTTGATPARLNTCAGTLTTASCASIRDGTAGCRYMGTLAPGAGCFSNSQCLSSYCKYGSGPCGVCANRVNNGGTCTASEDCQDGSGCASGICRARGGSGAACSSVQPCGDGLWCKTGTCAASGKTVGAVCDGNNGNSCDYLSGMFCTAADTCAQITFNNAGQSCGVTANTFVQCSFAGTCKIPAGTLSGTCIAAIPDGQSCNPAQGLNCIGPARCTAGVCTITNPASCL